MEEPAQPLTHELRPMPRTANTHTEHDQYDNGHIQVLPPVDRGPGAWKFLFASFLIEALLWGIPLSFGVFQDYYSRQPQFQDSQNITIIGTLSTSIYFLGAPLVMPLVRRFQRWQRHMVVVGSACCVLSLLVASFCDSVSGLIATQGVFYGLGYLVLYFPLLCMLNEWFVQRRGLAYGVLYGGGGFIGVGLPFLLETLLSKYGYRTTLRAVAIAQFATLAPALPLIKSRLPPSTHTAVRQIDTRFFSEPLFYCFALSNLFQGLVYYIPSLYLPTFASTLGMSSAKGALILGLYNFATVIGQVTFGWLSDRVQSVLILAFASSLVSSIVSFAVWGFARSLESILMFALAYGWFAGGYVVFWAKFGSSVSEDPQPAFSLMAFGRGIGNIATGPIAARLLAGPVTSGYGLGKFQPLILFLGSSMLCSSLGVVGLRLKKPR
ncbi:monocarboxylate transporter [Thelonectria olida]|uniref:Monocarboxylate transporter n=1 Tax=Thelonectria olida TaxID=1576542 RepID=A0A9P8VZA1_9HYPO|nr:monocarboxylate transporter [Thelonectria olida]